MPACGESGRRIRGAVCGSGDEQRVADVLHGGGAVSLRCSMGDRSGGGWGSTFGGYEGSKDVLFEKKEPKNFRELEGQAGDNVLEHPVIDHAFVVLGTGQVGEFFFGHEVGWDLAAPFCLNSAATSPISVFWCSARGHTPARPRRSINRALASSTKIRTSGPARRKTRRRLRWNSSFVITPHNRTAPANARPARNLPPPPVPVRYALARKGPPCQARPDRKGAARLSDGGGKSSFRSRLKNSTAKRRGRQVDRRPVSL